MPEFNSRKFRTLVYDVVLSLIVYCVTEFIAPDIAQRVLTIIGLLQPLVLAVVVMWGIEDAAAKRAGNDPRPE